MEIQKYQEKIFEDIKYFNENNEEYWEARELMKVLLYSKWSNFKKVIALGQSYFAVWEVENQVSIYFELYRPMLN